MGYYFQSQQTACQTDATLLREQAYEGIGFSRNPDGQRNELRWSVGKGEVNGGNRRNVGQLVTVA